jgi:hypothetical protein
VFADNSAPQCGLGRREAEQMKSGRLRS